MENTTINVGGLELPLYAVNTLIIGSGAASLNTVLQLHRRGQHDLVIVTDLWGGGTSNNTGSDKQTYYKVSLTGNTPDSVAGMAEDLFRGGCMHGDIALCEAQNSAQAFYNLVQLGVPFPHDRFGGYVGYKTDHDPRARATSAGPLTSQQMFTCLAEAVHRREIAVFDRHQVIGLFFEEARPRRIAGALALNYHELDSPHFGLVAFNAVNVVLGTGGPAGMYQTSVYPESQCGMSGMAYEIGAVGHNLTESQYGLASIKFRWNLSGSYQQVIPRYVSTDQQGNDEVEFLNGFFPDMGSLATAIFLKGYQWPFDPRKVLNYGSSLIDLLVFREIAHEGRRVFLDFQKDPSGCGVLEDFRLNQLAPEAYAYLKQSGALQKTPIKRLAKMNQPAIDLYAKNGIDLPSEYLEIAVCAQHNNGGLKGNIWWESNIKHLFPVGEANGTHGVYRPGGSALNAGQVGGLRAAAYIAGRYRDNPPETKAFLKKVRNQIADKVSLIQRMIGTPGEGPVTLQQELEQIQQRMSEAGAHIREKSRVESAVKAAWDQYRRMRQAVRVESCNQLPAAFRNLDICLTHALYLEAILEYLEQGGQSRGSYLVMDGQGEVPSETLGVEWAFSLANPEDGGKAETQILEIRLNKNKVEKEWVEVRPIPDEDQWFENVWNAYMRDEIIQ
jgi:succinate dehydrogenase/fumarate reductase flavoprotein subunit